MVRRPLAKSLVMKRALVQITLLYVAGILLGEFLNMPLAALLLLSFGCAGAAFLFRKWRLIFLSVLVFLTGWSNNAFHLNIISPYDLRIEFGEKPELGIFQGRLVATPKEKLFVWDEEETWRSVAELEVTACEQKGMWRPAFGTVFVSTPDRLASNIFKGQIVEVTGVISPPRGPLAEGLFDYRTYLRRQGMYFQLKAGSPSDWALVDTGQTHPLSDRFIAWTKKVLSVGLPEDDTTHLLWTLVLDWKAVFTDEAEEPFMRAGTYHIFAVDGLRIVIVAGIVLGLLRLLRVPREVCGLIIIPLIWFYTGVTDWPPSAIRASIMMTVVVGSWVLRRPSDAINSLFAAAFIILLWEPQQLFQAGFQLSFFVVLCIVLLFPVMERLRNKLMKTDPFLPDELRPGWRRHLDIPVRYMIDMLISSWAAWIGSIPLAAYYFHLFTPVSTPANVLVVPLTFLTLISCLLSLLFWWVPPLVSIFNQSSWFLMKTITGLSQWSVKWPATFCYVSTPSLLTIVVFYLFLLTLHTEWFWKSKRKLPFIAVLAVAAIVWFGYELREHQFTRIHVLPLSGGHAVFVDTPKSTDQLLIYCGNEAAAEFVVKPFLRAHGVNRLPRFILSHGDLRYIGGAQIISTNFFPEEFFTSPVRARSSAYRQFVESQKNTKHIVNSIGAGEKCGAWSVLYPSAADHFPQADDNAMVLKGQFGPMRILLCSDLAREGQRALLARGKDLEAEVVVSGLPRQGEPLSGELLSAIKPKLILMPDAESPATERASAKLRERLAAAGQNVLYGHERGAALIEADSHGYRVITIKQVPDR
ncbi:MAG: ComEC/Rec2-related protein [Verrucomicrobiales bacterium]|nr:ComEC/Rec2-related protein [Verrucomicrobiales bacterium]